MSPARSSSSDSPSQQTERRVAVFDLDGTLVDTGLDIANAVNRALRTLGRSERGFEEVRGFLGGGARRLVELALGESPEDALVDRGLELFSGYYEQDLVVESRPYPGIVPMLRELAAGGCALAVLSNKPHQLTVRVIRELFPSTPWGEVVGFRPGHSRKPDPADLLEICRSLHGQSGASERPSSQPDVSFMVGDTHFDVGAARAAQIESIGVTWGGTSADALERAGADRVATEPLQLVGWILGSGD